MDCIRCNGDGKVLVIDDYVDLIEDQGEPELDETFRAVVYWTECPHCDGIGIEPKGETCST